MHKDGHLMLRLTDIQASCHTHRQTCYSLRHIFTLMYQKITELPTL